MTAETSETETPSPGFILPGLRAGLEMALVAIVIALLGLPATDPVGLGLVLLCALLGMTVMLFWAVNRHVRRWIMYAQGKPTQYNIFD